MLFWIRTANTEVNLEVIMVLKTNKQTDLTLQAFHKTLGEH